MQTGEFVAAFREAFGPVPELPLLFRYTDEPLRPAAKAGGCFFKALAEARDGRPVGLNASNIGCGGGKFYTGFSPMPEFVPQFVSLKERYKQTPEMVLDFIAALDLRPGPKAWLEFVRVDAAGTFDGAEGVLFFATPDVLAARVVLPISGRSRSWRVRDSRCMLWPALRWGRWSGACMPRGISNPSRSGCIRSTSIRFSGWSILR